MIRVLAVSGWEVAVKPVKIPTGVLLIELSINVMDPTPSALEPPADISIPTWQLLMLIP
jgi:hypothetical protein